jgi:undecaprenyl-diphosphatase
MSEFRKFEIFNRVNTEYCILNTMLENLINIDKLLSGIIYTLPHPLILQFIFQTISVLGNFYVIAAVILIYIIIVGKINKHLFSVIFIITVFSAYLINNLLLKNLFARPRPDIIIPSFMSGNFLFRLFIPHDFSFPSSHAAVAFAAAYTIGYFDKPVRKYFYLLAILIAFSRVYLGYHYLGDVIAGSIIGVLISYLVIKIIPVSKIQMSKSKLQNKSKNQMTK